MGFGRMGFIGDGLSCWMSVLLGFDW